MFEQIEMLRIDMTLENQQFSHFISISNDYVYLSAQSYSINQSFNEYYEIKDMENFIINTPTFASYLGFLALCTYIITLLPTILRIVFPVTKNTSVPKILLKYRRQIGVISFVFGACHGILLFMKRNFDVFDIDSYFIYLQGIVILAIFTLLAVTSNNWSMKKLKKDWRKLHYLTYTLMFLLTWHISDKMFGKWSYLTPLGIIGSIGITVLFLIRKWIEYKKKKGARSS